jgi:protein SCO1
MSRFHRNGGAYGVAMLLAAILPAAALVPSSAMAQGFDPLGSAPKLAANEKIVEKPNAQVPLNLHFTDESGKDVKLGDYFHPNRPVLLTMVYFGCPRLCNLSLNDMTKALRKIDLEPGKQFEIVTVSFNPEEGPELAAAKKKNYVESLGKPEAASGWHFLTNRNPDIAHQLGDAIGFGFRLDPAQPGSYQHETGLFVCTPEGRLSRVQRGLNFESDVLRDSLINASTGKISSGLFGVALACGLLQFDMSTGKYTWHALMLMRVTAIATFILLASAIGWMLYRESRQKVSGTLRVPPAIGTRSVPDTRIH